MSRNKEHRPNVAAAPLRPPPKAAPLCSLFLLIYLLYYEYLWMFPIYSFHIPYIYIYIFNIFHTFSCVCFVIYSVNSRSGHDRSQSFG